MKREKRNKEENKREEWENKRREERKEGSLLLWNACPCKN